MMSIARPSGNKASCQRTEDHLTSGTMLKVKQQNSSVIQPSYSIQRDIVVLGRIPFYLNTEATRERRRRDGRMIEEKAKELDQEVLGMFRNSYMRRYERWKRRDLLLVALQTMPKQVKKEKVIDHLIELKSEFSKRLKDET